MMLLSITQHLLENVSDQLYTKDRLARLSHTDRCILLFRLLTLAFSRLSDPIPKTKLVNLLYGPRKYLDISQNPTGKTKTDPIGILNSKF